MSDIWKQCDGASALSDLYVSAWRVEDSKILDSQWEAESVANAEGQSRLKELLAPSYTPEPVDILDFLVSKQKERAHLSRFASIIRKPFHSPPLRHASRFGTEGERGVWYGALSLETALCEMAFYKFVFSDDSREVVYPLNVLVDAYSVEIETHRGVDLTRAPFDDFRQQISSPGSWAASQQLGAAMRSTNVSGFVYWSARTSQDSQNVGLFEPAFADIDPIAGPLRWNARLSRDVCEWRSVDEPETTPMVFSRENFERYGLLVHPAESELGGSIPDQSKT